MKFDLFSGARRSLHNPARSKAIVLHGLDHRGKDMRGFASHLQPYYDSVVIGDYDWRDSFNSLSERLNEFISKETNGRAIDIIGHSYGGLVARHYVETVRPTRAARIRNLMMVNTPNHGSALFNLMRSSPLIEYPSRYGSRVLKSFRLLALDDRDKSIQSITEMGRAENELDKLNAGQRNPSVSYWVIATERDWWRVGGRNWELPESGPAEVFHLLLTPPASNAFVKIGSTVLTPESYGHSDALHRPWATGLAPLIKRIASPEARSHFTAVVTTQTLHFNAACRALQKAAEAHLSRLSPGRAVHRICSICTALEPRSA